MHRSEFLNSLSAVLSRAIEADDAAFGNVQQLTPDASLLEIVAQCGFSPSFLAHFKFVSARDNSACGRALRLKARVAISDVLTDPLFAPFVDVATEAGYRAVQSTPIAGPRNRILGVLSTHFREPHVLTRGATRRLDACARDAAAIIIAYEHDGRPVHGDNPASRLTTTGLSRQVRELVARLKDNAGATFTEDERALLWEYVRRTPLLTSDEAELVRLCVDSRSQHGSKQ